MCVGAERIISLPLCQNQGRAEHRALVLTRAAGEKRDLCSLRTEGMRQCSDNFIYQMNTLLSGCWIGLSDPFDTPVLQIMDCFRV